MKKSKNSLETIMNFTPKISLLIQIFVNEYVDEINDETTNRLIEFLESNLGRHFSSHRIEIQQEFEHIFHEREI